MGYPLELGGQLLRPLDVSVLRRLVAATQKQDDFFAGLLVIDAIAGSVIDAHLTYAVANRLHVTGIAKFKPLYARQDLGERP